MSFRSTRSSCDDSVPIVDRLMGNLACGYALDDEMAKFFDIPQLLLIKVSGMFLVGNTSGMTMTETCRHYNIEDDNKFQTIIIEEALRRNALPNNHEEYLRRGQIFDLYGIGSAMLTRYKDRFSKGESLVPEKGRKPFLSKASEAALMDDFKDTMTTKSKATMEDIKESACKHRKIQQNQGPLAPQPEPSHYQILQIRQRCLPESVKNPAMTNTRREEALGDPYNAISNAVIAMTILAPTSSRPNGRFDSECIVNFDAMSQIIGRP